MENANQEKRQKMITLHEKSMEEHDLYLKFIEKMNSITPDMIEDKDKLLQL
jgi:hypothetical protein